MNILKILPVALVLVLSCTSKEELHEVKSSSDHTSFIATLQPIGESSVAGIVKFENSNGNVSVKAELSGLTEGKHGFHIHQYGDCSALDGTSAGGHFNPKEKEHSNPQAENRHMGDMGNITADAEGNATLDYQDPAIVFEEILGRGIIVHAGEDDLSSQPSGAAGSRIACGVIGIQK